MALTFGQPLTVYAKNGAGTLTKNQISITLDASYAAGGIALTPAQLGQANGVVFGVVNVRTVSATGPSNGVLDCTSQTAPKLKLQNAGATAELGAGAASGAVIDVISWGY
jgi:hypothetical protein